MTNALTTNIPLSHWFHSRAQCYMAWKMPSVNLSHLSWLCPLLSSCVPPDYLLVGQNRGGKESHPGALRLYKHWAATSKLWCVTNTVSDSNSKHSRQWRKLTPSQPDPVQGLIMFCSCKSCCCERRGAPVPADIPMEEPDMSGYHCKPTNQLKSMTCGCLTDAAMFSPCLKQSELWMHLCICFICIQNSTYQTLNLVGPKLCSTAGKCMEEAGREAQGQGCVEDPSPGRANRGVVARTRSGSTAEVYREVWPQAWVQRWGRQEHMRSRVGWKSSMCAGKMPRSWLHAQKMTKEGTRKGPTKWPSCLGNLIMASAWAVVIPCWCKVRVEATVRAEGGKKQAMSKADVWRDWVRD